MPLMEIGVDEDRDLVIRLRDGSKKVLEGSKSLVSGGFIDCSVFSHHLVG